ncbi:STT3 domain-containing protein [Chloroflexota bacterium]
MEPSPEMRNSWLVAAAKLRPPEPSIIGLALAISFSVSLGLRVLLPYEMVLGGDWVRFLGADSWYHIRLLENLVAHFPHRIVFDPYTFYPHGQLVFFGSFYDQLVGFIAWVLGGGSPSQQLTHTVAAYIPPALGALAVFPVYFLARALFNWQTGLIASALVAILPGELMYRTLLGFADHHAAEILFSTVVMLFFSLAVMSANRRAISFHHLARADWRRLACPLIYSASAGIALGLYLLAWTGGLLFVFIIFLYAVIQHIIDHMRGASTDYLSIVGMPSFLLALLFIFPSLNTGSIRSLHIITLVMGALSFPALSGISRLMASRGMPRQYYPASVVALGVFGLTVLYSVNRFLFGWITGQLQYVFVPQGGGHSSSRDEVAIRQPGWFLSRAGLGTVWRRLLPGSGGPGHAGLFHQPQLEGRTGTARYLESDHPGSGCLPAPVLPLLCHKCGSAHRICFMADALLVALYGVPRP